MPEQPKRYQIYRWAPKSQADQMRLFGSVGISECSALFLLDRKLLVEEDDCRLIRSIRYFRDHHLMIDGGRWYFPRELVEEVRGTCPRHHKKRRLVLTNNPHQHTIPL